MDPPVFKDPPKRYAAFIFYSHGADGAFAPELLKCLQQLAKPWNKRRALEVFRDHTGLAVSTELWPSICAALDGSQWFVLLASPEVAHSDWVGKEIERWVATKGSERILPVLTDGAWVWNAETNDFDHENSTAVHPSLCGVFRSQPLYLDMIWAKNEHHLTVRNARFRDQVADLAAPMHGITKDELEGEDVREQNLTQRLKRAAISSLALLFALAVAAGLIAFRQYRNAIRQRDNAIFNQITAQADRLRSTDVSLAAQLDLTAYRMQPENQDLYTALITAANADLSTPLTRHTDTVSAVAFSPDGHTLATGSYDRTVRLWNVADPTHLASLGPPLSGHTDSVSAVAFSPDGHTLATGSGNQTVQLWNVTNLAQPTPLTPPLAGHTNSVTAVAFSPDGHTLVSGSADQTVRIWDVTHPAQSTPRGRPLTGHTNFVFSVAFSPDGRTLATGSFDQTARLWEMNVDRSIQRICATTRNTLTPATWEQYVSKDLPYRSPCS
jgi:WD40 repeat protein